MAEPVRIVKRQILSCLSHNRALYDPDFFGKGRAVLFVERVTLSNGRRVKRGVVVENPNVKYNVTAEAYREKHRHPAEFVPLGEVDEWESDVRNIDRDAAEFTGQMDFYNETRGPGANRRRRKIHGHRWLHGTDVDLADHYMDRWMQATPPEEMDLNSPLEMSFGDIEVDPINISGFPDEFDAPAPVTVITDFHAPSSALVMFLARNMCRPNPLVAEFEADLPRMSRMVRAECNRAPLEKAGLVPEGCPWEAIDALLEAPAPGGVGPEHVRCEKVDIRFFDTELELILAFLHHVNEVERPDTFAFWNACFDLNTLLNRLRKLGVDPQKAFTAKAFEKWPYADYRLDTFHTEPTDNGDMFTAAGYTMWLDQMLIYASLRKQSEGKKESYGLDYTLSAMLKESKYKFEGSIRDLAYRDYKSFVVYSAIDVVPMAALEKKTEDIALCYRISMLTRTRIHKVMKKTVVLRNLAAVFLRERGYAISNNRNRLEERTESEKFRGGFVADPRLLEFFGAVIDGVRSNRVFDGVVDLDATALYPSIILTANIDAAGQLGRLLLYLADGSPVDGSEFVEAVAGGSLLQTGRDWMNLPGLGELASAVLGIGALKPSEREAPAPEAEAETEEETEGAE